MGNFTPDRARFHFRITYIAPWKLRYLIWTIWFGHNIRNDVSSRQHTYFAQSPWIAIAKDDRILR